MWCLRLNDDGSFRSAHCHGRIAVTLIQWHSLDRAAAEDAFPHLAIQRRFMRAAGLVS